MTLHTQGPTRPPAKPPPRKTNPTYWETAGTQDVWEPDGASCTSLPTHPRHPKSFRSLTMRTTGAGTIGSHF